MTGWANCETVELPQLDEQLVSFGEALQVLHPAKHRQGIVALGIQS
jgi:hypothetical protein